MSNTNGDYYLYTPGYSEEDYFRDGRNRKMAKGPAREYARACVKRDVDRVEAWLKDNWCFVGVCVTCPELGFDESLWGIESDGDYWREVALEMIERALTN